MSRDDVVRLNGSNPAAVSLSRATGAMRLRSSAPRITLVIAVNEDPVQVGHHLSTLSGAIDSANVEVVVAWSESPVEVLPLLHPSTRSVVAPAGASLAELRQHGMQAASGDVVVFLESLSDLDVHWLHHLCAPYVASGPSGAQRLPDTDVTRSGRGSRGQLALATRVE
jgi:hypothetical protein